MTPGLRLITALGVVLACAACAPTAVAQQAEPEAVQTPEGRGVAQLITAAELAAWGREHRDPEALRVAARMLDQVPLRAGSGGDPGVAPVLNAAALRQEAAGMRSDVLIDEIAVTGARAWTDLPARCRQYLQAIAKLTGAKLSIVSVGPGREQTILL